MAKQRIVIPILNWQEEAEGEESILLSLDKNTFVRTIHDEDYVAFDRFDNDDYRSLISSRIKCIYVAIGEEKSNNLEETLAALVLHIQTVLNFFTTEHPAALSFAAIIEDGPKARISEVFDLRPIENLHQLSTNRYGIRLGLEDNVVAETYKLIAEEDSRHEAINITLERFNSCLAKTHWPDKIIDATICLESMIPASAALKFKFSLFISYIISTDADERLANFKLLRTLYDCRSDLVHGKSDKEGHLEDVKSNWGSLKRTMRQAITYYLLFLRENGDQDSWDLHLLHLVLGKDNNQIPAEEKL